MNPTASPRSSAADSTDPVRWAFDRLRVDHRHTRFHHRIARALAGRLPKLLEDDERVLGFTEAVEDSDFLTKTMMGFGWPLWRRVALVFTDRRLLEIGLACCGRRARGRIRSFPWDRLPGFETEDFSLQVTNWQEQNHSWRLRGRFDAALERSLRQRVDLAVSTYQPSEGLAVPITLCPDCGGPVRSPRGSCAQCGGRVRSARLAALLAISFPGAGHAYTGRWMAATMRSVAELLAYGWLASRMLAAGTTAEFLVPALAGVVAIGVMKLTGSAVARRLASRAGLVTPTAERRWRWFAGLAGAVSIAAVVLPLVQAGQLDSDIGWDLDFIATDGAWTRHRSTSQTDDSTRDDTLRSRWIHRAGLQADVHARPMRPFESVRDAEERIITDAGGDVETMDLGPHRVLVTRIDGEAQVTMRFAIVDGEGRDLHVISAQVAAADIDRSTRNIERLISRGIWIPASRSRADRP
jgi:hypothetical protein